MGYFLHNLQHSIWLIQQLPPAQIDDFEEGDEVGSVAWYVTREKVYDIITSKGNELFIIAVRHMLAHEQNQSLKLCWTLQRPLNDIKVLLHKTR